MPEGGGTNLTRGPDRLARRPSCRPADGVEGLFGGLLPDLLGYLALLFLQFDARLKIAQILLRLLDLQPGLMNLMGTGTGHLAQGGVYGARAGEGILSASIAVLQPLHPALTDRAVVGHIE